MVPHSRLAPILVGLVWAAVPALAAGEEERPEGWDGSLKLGASLSLAQNSNVVGQPSGVGFLVGASAVSALEYRSGAHELRGALTLIEAFARTPAVGSLVKTSDLAQLEILYSFYLVSWLGAFGRAMLEVPLLPTEDARGTPVTYRVLGLDGTVESFEDRTGRRLASAFDPLSMSQSAGVVAKPFSTEPATLTARLGFGLRESWTGDTQILADEAATRGIIEVKRLDDVFQGGAELAIGLAGKLPDYRVSYGVDAGMLLPLLNNDPKDRGAFELFRAGVTGNVNYSLYDWLLLTYQLKVLNDPQIVERVQIQNNVLVSFQWELIPPRRGKPAAPDPIAALEEKARAAEERARAAEERARAAEERARARERQPPKGP